MVVYERWSLTRGGRKGRFDCILLGLKDKMTVTRGLGKNSEKEIYLTADWKKGIIGEVLLSSFNLNDHTLGFYPQTQKVELNCTE